MSLMVLSKLLAHNNWANLKIFDACANLSDEQLDYQPQSATRGTIRETLHHVALSQEDYACMLIHFDHPSERPVPPTLKEVRNIIETSGEDIRIAIQEARSGRLDSQIHLTDGYKVDPWVFVLQIINHATEHREQIKSILTALAIEPPRIDGWAFARLQDALVAPE